MSGANKTVDDTFHQSLLGATTNASQDYHSMNKSYGGEDGFQLPSIKNPGSKGSPFKGFLDISLVTQKLRKSMHSQDGLSSPGNQAFEFGAGGGSKHQKRGRSKGQGGPFNAAQTAADLKRAAAVKGTRFQSTDKQVQMAPKVLETWINETLQDAEHLDIPGVILKPEHQLPINRYGIDSLILTNAGIPKDLVERIYRSLFVYSVGFYELIKSALQHTEKKYSMITNIWKVFAILLEYCCRTDYRMLISEISKEHKAELDALDREYQKKAEEQANNEKHLKETLETQYKLHEELERELMNEKQIRMKLEEDYTQNTKNHEEEVQLRLKFESKLNNMHSAHRDLESKYKRILSDLGNAQKQLKMLNEKLSTQNDEVTQLRTTEAEHLTQLTQNREEIDSQKRELGIKARQMKDADFKVQKIQDQLDLYRYKVQDGLKDNTELKLKMDVLQSTNEGLSSEKKHLMLELNQTKELLAVFEDKTKSLMEDLQNTTGELQANKREMIGFSEVNRDREEKIQQLKNDLTKTRVAKDDFEIKLGTLQITYDKVEEQLSQTKADHDDLVEKLHKMNKARHDLETKLSDEMSRNRDLNDVVSMKEEALDKQRVEMEEQDRKIIELDRRIMSLESDKQGVERAFELAKKQLNERITNLNEVITGEKETRDMWIERYEKEQKDHTLTSSNLLEAKSSLKDSQLEVKSVEIKLNTANRQIQTLNEQVVKLQHQVNEAMAKSENLDRELSTQKEILKQMENTKKEYIEKLKKELSTIEQRYQHLINEQQMIGEDFRARASENLIYARELEAILRHKDEEILEREVRIESRDTDLVLKEREMANCEMQFEEMLTRFDTMRSLKSKTKEELVSSQIYGRERDAELIALKSELEQIEKNRIQNQQEVMCQTVLKMDYFDRKQPPAGNTSGAQSNSNVQGGSASIDQRSIAHTSSRQSGSLASQGSGQGRGGAGARQGRRVGGGGMIANKPPVGGGRMGRGSRQISHEDQSQGSRQGGIAIDTNSSISNAGASPRLRQNNRSGNGPNTTSNQQQQQPNSPGRRTGNKLGSQQQSNNNINAAEQSNQSGSGSQIQSRTMDQRSESLKNPGSGGAQSQQQFKTMDNTKEANSSQNAAHQNRSLSISQSQEKLNQGIETPNVRGSNMPGGLTPAGGNSTPHQASSPRRGMSPRAQSQENLQKKRSSQNMSQNSGNTSDKGQDPAMDTSVKIQDPIPEARSENEEEEKADFGGNQQIRQTSNYPSDEQLQPRQINANQMSNTSTVVDHQQNQKQGQGALMHQNNAGLQQSSRMKVTLQQANNANQQSAEINNNFTASGAAQNNNNVDSQQLDNDSPMPPSGNLNHQPQPAQQQMIMGGGQGQRGQILDPQEQQAALLAEQQRMLKQQEEARKREMHRLQSNQNKLPKGNTNIRKLISSAQTRDL